MFADLVKLAGYVADLVMRIARGNAKPPPAPAQDAIDARIDGELADKRTREESDALYAEVERAAVEPVARPLGGMTVGGRPMTPEEVAARATRPLPIVDAFVKASRYTLGRSGVDVLLCVIHTTENDLRKGIARTIALDFATTTDARSATYVVDADEVIQCVREEDTSYTASAPANALGIHVELCARAAWGPVEWAHPDAVRMLERAARLVADVCERRGLPIEEVSIDGLLDGHAGITTHAACSKAWKRSTHWDPGPAFPMAAFLAMVRESSM